MQVPSMLRACPARTLRGLRQRSRQVQGAGHLSGYATLENRFPLYNPPPQGIPTGVEAPQAVPRSRRELLNQIEQLSSETRELKAVAASEEKAALSKELTADLPEWTEEDLQSFYLALIASPADDILAQTLPRLEAPNPQNQRLLIGDKERNDILQRALARLRRARAEGEGEENDLTLADLENEKDQPGIAVRGQKGISQHLFSELRHSGSVKDKATGSEEEGNNAKLASVGLLTPMEAECLFEELVRTGNTFSAKTLLDMSDSGLVHLNSEEGHLYALQTLSHQGNIAAVASYLKSLESFAPAKVEYLHHLVEAHIKAARPHEAVRLLHHFEERNQILPITSYALVIDTLLTPKPTQSQSDKALAWDLFAHMRLTAHPTPSVELYTSIIRSCADPYDPQPERALDLLTELQQDSGLIPSGETYTAAIAACSKVKTFYAESFRLLTQMLEVHEAALTGGLPQGQQSGYEPSVLTFNALLEGTKRAGDLSRARWILQEMFKLAKGWKGGKPNADTMVNVFHTYAAFVPKVTRGDVKLNGIGHSEEKKSEKEMRVDSEGVRKQNSAVESAEVSFQPEDASQIFTPISDISDRTLSMPLAPPSGPLSARETLTEATQLLDFLLHNILSITPVSDSESVFSEVAISARVVNAYLSVLLAHAPLEEAIHGWNSIWEDERVVQLGLRRSGWTWLMGLQKIASVAKMSVNTSTRRQEFVGKTLSDMWKGYRGWSVEDVGMGKGKVERYLVGLGDRQVEKSWIAGIKWFALIGDTDRALSLLKEFRSLYPASLIRSSYQPLPTFSNLIRLSISSQMMEDDVPPHILFHDIEALHHKLAVKGDVKGLGYVKWFCMDYESALRKRRRMRLEEKGGGSRMNMGRLLENGGKKPRSALNVG